MIRRCLLTFTVLACSMPAIAAAPTNDRINRATVVRTLPFVDTLDTSEAVTALNDPECVGQGPTVWFKYRSSGDHWIDANTFGSDYDTTLSVYTYTRGRMLSQLACNDDYDSLQSRVRVRVSAGVTYYIMVGAYASGPGGLLTLSVDESADQRVTTLDVRINAAVLDSATGLVTVQGTMSCSGPQTGYMFGQVTQKRASGVVGAHFSTEVRCTTGTITWTAVTGRARPVRASASSLAAVFRRGRAFVSGRVAMWDESTGALTEGQAVARLRIY